MLKSAKVLKFCLSVCIVGRVGMGMMGRGKDWDGDSRRGREGEVRDNVLRGK